MKPIQTYFPRQLPTPAPRPSPAPDDLPAMITLPPRTPLHNPAPPTLPPPPAQIAPPSVAPALMTRDPPRLTIPGLRQLHLPESHHPRNPAHLSTHNQKSNVPWGDTLSLQKPENTFRLYGINPNGFRMDKQGGDLTEFFAINSSLQVDLVGCPEHNLDFTQFRVQNSAHQAIRHTVEHSKTVWSNTPTQFDNMYKPGGTMTSVLGNTVARVKETGADDLGRWSYVKLSGKDNKVITFITVYQVCKKPPAAVERDSCTAHTQQRSLLTQRKKGDPNPIKHFRLDLAKFLKSCQSNGEQLLLFGDFNEVLGSDSAGISKLAREFQLVDVMHRTHALPDPATYARGRTRIDYVLASIEVFHAVNECGYEPFNENFLSDHRGYFVDFDLHKLFGNELQRLASLPFRDVRGEDTTSVTQYVEAKDTYLTDHNFLHPYRNFAATLRT
jgi:hypothetical protein